jgi:hypothetical protein
MIHVSHWRPLSRAVLLAVAVGGVAAVALVPGDSASKTALGLGAVAIAIAAGNYAESPDWNEVEKDVKRLRQIADGLGSTAVDSQQGAVESSSASVPRWLVPSLLIIWLCGRSRKRHR